MKKDAKKPSHDDLNKNASHWYRYYNSSEMQNVHGKWSDLKVNTRQRFNDAFNDWGLPEIKIPD